MKYIVVVLAVTTTAWGAACSSATPTVAAATEAVKQGIAATNDHRLSVVSVKKLDGQMQVGDQEYVMDVEVTLNCDGGAYLWTFCSNNGTSRSRVIFQKKESGWVGAWVPP